MKVIYTPRAEADLEERLLYGRDKFGETVANRTFQRTIDFITNVIAPYPRTGRYHSEIDAFEIWVPKTPFVIFYRIEEATDRLWVLAVFHHAQDRESYSGDR